MEEKQFMSKGIELGVKKLKCLQLLCATFTLQEWIDLLKTNENYGKNMLLSLNTRLVKRNVETRPMENWFELIIREHLIDRFEEWKERWSR